MTCYREKLLGAKRFTIGPDTAHVIVPAASVDQEGHLMQLGVQGVWSEAGTEYCLPTASKVGCKRPPYPFAHVNDQFVCGRVDR